MIISAQNFDSVDADPKKTSQITPKMIGEFVDYVILGHSEVRNFDKASRKYLGDTPEIINTKNKLAQDEGLETIVCISDIAGELESFYTANPDYSGIIAYEPISNVGTGVNLPAKDANKKAKEILKKFKNAKVIYGGSVKGENARDYFIQPYLSGVLVGNGSSDPEFFSKIINAFPKE
ncbi:MAG: Triosephosphate isomerase [Candidatus Roizmanbacteria bacterium GW2011_GWA2_35_19]|uniref:Triosephosphate isomerase n=1 Tax=Candidatus Roizmanbacteria bacterium GW2011_GWA2_35_19 TaxID=1618478 RepID=A0A0G0E3Z9_9BACT|nr:MAG: Triosephosphate isomerase [Candidatus Roizmanbacteria bacterium GW2011_GWA2_35_19]